MTAGWIPRYGTHAFAVWIAVGVLGASEHHGAVKSGGLPLPGVTITMAQGDKKLVTTTDERGAYSFPDLADGVWNLEIEMFGFAKITRDIGIAPNAPSPEWELKLLTLQALKQELAPRQEREPETAAGTGEGGTPPGLQRFGDRPNFPGPGVRHPGGIGVLQRVVPSVGIFVPALGIAGSSAIKHQRVGASEAALGGAQVPSAEVIEAYRHGLALSHSEISADLGIAAYIAAAAASMSCLGAATRSARQNSSGDCSFTLVKKPAPSVMFVSCRVAMPAATLATRAHASGVCLDRQAIVR